MKKTWLLLSSIFMLLSFVSCDTNSSTEISEEQKMEYKIEGETFKLSTIVDETLDDGVRSYSVIAPHTDTYTLKCTKSSKIVVYDEKSVLKEGTTELEVSLEEVIEMLDKNEIITASTTIAIMHYLLYKKK